MINRAKNITYNNLAQGIYQLLAILAGLYLTKYIIINFGSELNGLLVSTNQILGYFALVEAGISGCVTYALYKPLYDANENEINSLLRTSKSHFFKAGFMFICLTITYLFFIIGFESHTSLDKQDLLFFIIVLAIPKLLQILLLSKYLAIFVSGKKQYIISLASAAFIITNFLVIVISTRTGCDLAKVKLFAVIATIVQILVFAGFFKYFWPRYHFSSSKTEDKLKNRNDVFWNQVISNLIVGLPIFLTSILLDLKTVSVVSLYLLLIHSISGFISIWSNNLIPHFGEILISKEKYLAEKIFKNYEYYYFLLLTYSFGCAIFLMPKFLELYTKGIEDGNYIQPGIMKACLLLGVLNMIRAPGVVLMEADGRFKVTKSQLILQLASAILLGIFLASFFGLLGLLSGIAISQLLRNFQTFSYTGKIYPFINTKNTYKYLVVICLSLLINHMTTLIFEPLFTGYLDFVIYSIVVFIANFFVVFFIFEYFNDYGSIKIIMKKLK